MRFTCILLFPLIFSDGQQQDNTAGYAEAEVSGDEETLDGLHLRHTLTSFIRSGLDVLSNTYPPPTIYRDEMIVRTTSPNQDSGSGIYQPFSNAVAVPFNNIPFSGGSLNLPYSSGAVYSGGGGSLTVPYTGSGSVTLPYTGSGSMTLPIGGGGGGTVGIIGGGGGSVTMPCPDSTPGYSTVSQPYSTISQPSGIAVQPVQVAPAVIPRPIPNPNGLYLLMCDQSETRNCPIQDINLNRCVKVFLAANSCSRATQILPVTPTSQNVIPIQQFRGVFGEPLIRFAGENEENNSSPLSNVVSALTKTFGGAFEEVLKGLP